MKISLIVIIRTLSADVDALPGQNHIKSNRFKVFDSPNLIDLNLLHRANIPLIFLHFHKKLGKQWRAPSFIIISGIYFFPILFAGLVIPQSESKLNAV